MQDITGDADDTLDQGLPFGVGNCAGRAEYVNGPDLTPITCFGDRGIAAGWLLAGAGGFGILHQGGLVVLQLDNRMRLGLRGNLEGFFWQCSASRVIVLCATWSSPSNCCAAGISLDFSSISTCARIRPSLVSLGSSPRAGSRMQKLGSFAVSEIVETSPEHLPIKRDRVSRWIGRTVQETSSMAAENLLDAVRVKALQDVANGGMGWRALPAQTKGGVQSAAVYRDERFDRAIRIAAGHHGEDREQQNVRQLIELSFGPAWVRDLAQQADQLVERSQGNLLMDWLPCIDSEISPRRNPPISSTRRFVPSVASRTQPLRSVV